MPPTFGDPRTADLASLLFTGVPAGAATGALSKTARVVQANRQRIIRALKPLLSKQALKNLLGKVK